MRPWVFALATLLFAPSALAQAGGGENNATRSGVVFIPRLALLVAGGGELESECEGSGTIVCDGQPSTSIDYDDESRIAFGADILGNLSGNFRLGGGLWFVPSTEIESEGGGDADWGSDLTLSFIGEGVFDLTPSVALAGRFFAGAMVLFPGDNLDDAADIAETFCNTLGVAGADCEVNDGPFLGPTLGAGIGVIGSLGKVALRGDFLLQWYTLGLVGFEATAPGGEVEVTTRATGTRFWLSGGVEF
jgi:hypothetical protein